MTRIKAEFIMGWPLLLWWADNEPITRPSKLLNHKHVHSSTVSIFMFLLLSLGRRLKSSLSN